MRTFRKRFPILLLILLLLCGCGSKDKLTVVCPSIGSADCSLLMTETATILIDTGEDGDADEILMLLDRCNRTTIDLLVISHYDQDHVGGADKILNALEVKRVIGSTSPKESEDYDQYQEALAAKGLAEEIFSQPTDLELGGMKLTIYPPEASEYKKDQSNNASTVVSVHYGDTNFLFTGDAMKARMEELLPALESDGNTRFDFIKLPHHGREPKVARSLISAVVHENTSAVITSSEQEPEAVDIVEMLPVTVYLTRMGQITAVSDGSTVSISQTKNA